MVRYHLCAWVAGTLGCCHNNLTPSTSHPLAVIATSPSPDAVWSLPTLLPQPVQRRSRPSTSRPGTRNAVPSSTVSATALCHPRARRIEGSFATTIAVNIRTPTPSRNVLRNPLSRPTQMFQHSGTMTSLYGRSQSGTYHLYDILQAIACRAISLVLDVFMI